MPVVEYKFVERCAGGAHVTVDMIVDGGPPERIVLDIDQLRNPDRTLERDKEVALEALALRLDGLTRAETEEIFKTAGDGIETKVGVAIDGDVKTATKVVR